MPFEPGFIKISNEYFKEKEGIVTLDDWRKFSRKWFNSEGWPRRNNTNSKTVLTSNFEILKASGRSWSPSFFLYDITPEARYEMLTTSNSIGLPLAFPNGVHKPPSIGPTYGWSQYCPFDEISTRIIGYEACPICGRKMIYQWTGD